MNTQDFFPDTPARGAVVAPGEFVFAAVGLEHGHINHQVEGLCEAGGELKWVFDANDPSRAAALAAEYGANVARDLREILDDASVHMVTAADIPSRRAALGIACLEAGKDYFTDKTPMTTFEQLAEVRRAVDITGRRYMVYYSERLHTESGVLAGDLIDRGLIGRVIQVIGMGPHRLGPPTKRPDWFYRHADYGGILCDIGSHQTEQFLHYTGESNAEVQSARIANYAHPTYPEFEDFGDATLTGAGGATGYFRVDWFTPDGLRTWGDGRTIILGTEGFIEVRKCVNLAEKGGDGDHVFLVNGDGEVRLDARGRVGFPFFGALILDCLNRTENAMTQRHALAAAELCLKAQAQAQHLGVGTARINDAVGPFADRLDSARRRVPT